MKHKLSLVLLLLISAQFWACADLPPWLKKWQQEQIQKRYGTSPEKETEKIEDWEQDLQKYNEIINKKIEAADQSARLYRKIGEKYASVGMYEQCVTNMEQALKMGYTDAAVYYTLGLCYGNLAKVNNWDSIYTRNAEQAMLKALNLNPNLHTAKFQLGLIYFYGFGMLNKYSVEYGEKHIERDRFRTKAVELMVEYQNLQPEDTQSYFALGGMYSYLGLKNEAVQQYTAVLVQLNKLYGAKNAHKTIEYQQAMQNLNRINETIRKDNAKPSLLKPPR